LNSNTAVGPSFTAPNAAATLAFQLLVDDGNGGTDSDSVSVTVSGAIDLAQVREDFAEETGAFIMRRLERVLSNEPRMTRLEYRGGPGHLDASISSRDNVSNSDLSFSLNRVANNDTTIWAEGRFSDYSERRGNAEYGGMYGVVHFGADVRLPSSSMIGFMATLDAMTQNESNQSNISGTGWMLGPYFSAAIFDDISLSGRLAFGRTENDAQIETSGTTMFGVFSSNRFLARLNLTGETQFRRFSAIPEISIGYARERQEGYSASDGVTSVNISGQDVEFGQLEFVTELQLASQLLGEDGYYFARPSISAVFSETPNFLISSGISSALEFGYEASSSDGVRHGVSITIDGLGDENFQSAGIRAHFEWNF
jgi:hypothetical protein